MYKTTYKIGGYTITEEVREITPAEASEILAQHNTKNRRANRNHVNALALNMSSGTWRYNADPIRFDANGSLIDGQHRLMALVQSQQSHVFKLVYGLDPECFMSIDMEMKTRNLADLLSIDRVKHANRLAAIINRYFALHNGHSAISSSARSIGSSYITREETSFEEKYNFYYDNKDVFNEICWYSNNLYGSNRMLKITDIGGIFAYLYLDKGHSENSIKIFFHDLYVGSEFNCINALRNKLIMDLGATKKMTGQHRKSIIAKTWNLYVDGKDVKILSYNPTSEGVIEFS